MPFPAPNPNPASATTPASSSTTSVVADVEHAEARAQEVAEQWRRRREGSYRCEPFDCGHRDPLDCDAADCGDTATKSETTVADLPPESADVEPGDFAQLWADAKTSFLAKDFPKYASPVWVALHPDDPKRLAAALEAAEMWRKYGDEEALIQWFREASQARPSIAERRTRAELDALAKPKPPHQLRASPGWPPIAVPGQPGKYLTYRVQKAA